MIEIIDGPHEPESEEERRELNERQERTLREEKRPECQV